MSRKPRAQSGTPAHADAHLTPEQARRLTEKRPRDPSAWKTLGLTLLRAEQTDEALHALLQAQELRPGDAETLKWLGETEQKRGNSMEAEQYLKQALQIAPQDPEALAMHALIMHETGRTLEALETVERALAIKPAFSSATALRIELLGKLFRYDEALALQDELLKREPRSFAHWNNAGNLRRDLGRLDEACEYYRKGMELPPYSELPFCNLITAMHYNPHCSREEIFTALREWEQRYAPRQIPPRPEPENRQADRRLRIGMISDGFRRHPVGNMIISTLENLPGKDFEFFIYSTNRYVDELTTRFIKLGHFAQVVHETDDALAQHIRDDRIDILFDLCGHNAGTRSRVMAMQPAPLQVKWVGGLINTTGLTAIDYLLSDPIESPEGDDAFYTEKLIRMPGDYICYEPPVYTPEVAELPAQRNGYITLGCFNNPTKINPELLAEWALLMHELPHSRLFLKGTQYSSPALCEHVRQIMASHGIDAERLIIEGPAKHLELLTAYNRVDIALDPWPYSGGLTTCEALLMGVPVVTLPGPTFAGRHSATHLVNAGMPELVAADWAEYRMRVRELALDLDSLATIRRHLRDILLQSPVCNAEQFARHFSNAMRAIWQRYCAGKAPEALRLDEQGQAWFADESAPLPLQHAPEEVDENEFRFQFDGKIIALEQGTLLSGSPNFRNLQKLGAIATITFDPASALQAPGLLQANGELHHYPHAALGDGTEGTLYVCLDPAMSATLEPLPAEQQLPNHVQPTQLLTRLPISTLRLDDIEGLDSIDWLLLDNMNDSLTILENGEKALTNTLLVQVRVNFAPTHKNQPELTQISHWLSRHGFSFYRLTNLQHYSHLPKSGNFIKAQASQLMAADAIFIPNKPRLESLNKNNLIKLGLILHTVYGIEDLTSKILEKHSEHREKYLISAGYLESAPLTHPKTVEEALRKLENCKTAARQGSHSLPGKLLVSLTSYKDRFDNLHLTLRSLLCQNTRPEKTILWISESEKDLLPQNVLKLQEKGLEIRYCEDLRSYKKIIPALQEFPDWFIVTADDDIYYNDDWLGGLITAWNGDPKSIVAHRAHKIKLDKDGNPIKYKDWDWECRADKNPDGLIMPTSGSGVLFPPGSLHKECCLTDNFKTLCADTDDIWLYWMASINGSKAMLSNYKFKLIEWPQNKATPLWHKNISEGNDKNIKLMISRYGKPWEENSSRKAKEIHSTFTYKGRTVNFYLPNHEDHIQKIIKSSRSFYELEMLEDIASRCNPNGSIIDIGANIGNHTVFFGLFCGCRKIYSFEPQENVFKTLQENIKINNLETKVKAFMLGLGETESHATLGDVDPKNLGMTKLNKAEHGQIKIMPLESLIDPSEQISIIKIDVEGMEVDVLSGAKSLLKKQSPAIYAEAGTPEEFTRLRSFLSEYGYTPKSRFNATATYLFEK